MEEHIEQSPEADWTEMDLLTKDLAGSLLDKEIKADEQRIADLASRNDDPNARADREKLQQRVEAMKLVRDNVRARDAAQNGPS
jgi:hypothetical protein